MAKGWMFGAKNIPCLTISGYVCNKYPLQRDIFCLEASLNVGPFGELWEKGWPFGLMKKKPQLLLITLFTPTVYTLRSLCSLIVYTIVLLFARSLTMSMYSLHSYCTCVVRSLSVLVPRPVLLSFAVLMFEQD